jgi:hypothetical protein
MKKTLCSVLFPPVFRYASSAGQSDQKQQYGPGQERTEGLVLREKWFDTKLQGGDKQ